MTAFCYWIPNARTSIKLPEINSLGLGYALENQFTARGCTNGPDDTNGIVLCHGSNADGRLGYHEERQLWKQIPGSTVWCGHYHDELPTPEELLRKDTISGEQVVDDRGESWIAPIARKRVEENGELLWSYNVPRSLSLDESGQWIPGDVKPRYKRLWEDALLCERVMIDQEEIEVDIDDMAVRALQINYRVSAIELDMLGIYDETFRGAVVGALIDLQTLLGWLKKKTDERDTDGGSSVSGMTD